MGEPTHRTLRIQWIQIKSDQDWQEPYDLDGRLVAVLGPIDRGKTSMVDCIDYLLGRSVTFRGAVATHLRGVRAQLRIGDGTFVLCRTRRPDGPEAPEVQVSEANGTPIGTFPVTTTDGQTTISDWLLEQFGLRELFGSVTLPKGRTPSFAEDLLPYLHIRQEDIDRFVVRSSTSSEEDQARLKVARLLLGLDSTEVARVEAHLRALKNTIKRQSTELRRLETFLEDSESTRRETLDAEIARLRAEEKKADERHTTLCNQLQAATHFVADLRRQADQAHHDLLEAQRRMREAAEHHHKVLGTLTALDRAVAELEADGVTPVEQSSLELAYATCPACGSDLTGRVVDPGHCSLCTLPLPETARGEELAHLRRARQRARQELEESGPAQERARQELEDAQREFDRIRQLLDERTRTVVTPYVDTIATARADLESIRARLAELERLRRPYERLARRREQLDAQKADKKKAQQDLTRLRAELDQSQAGLDRLNELFLENIRAFGLPWATGKARLDPKTLLPLVDEQSFDQRGGGSRTAVSVAYSLALLMYALESPHLFRLPTLLILDSPQKNLGHNAEDQEVAARIYHRIGDYFEQRRQTLGGRYEHFQLIVVDNDLPAEVRPHFQKIVEFGEGHLPGFVRGLTDPHATPPPRTR
ncbi:MAG TPA: hypothetical protein VIL00_09410 [Pseudonocardiaceae bacterium]